MSGPKVSVYTLSAAERKIFYEQLEIIKQTEILLQKTTVGIDCANKEIEKLKGILKQGETLVGKVDRSFDFSEICEQIEEVEKTIDEVKKEQKRIREEYRVDKAGTVQMTQTMHAERSSKLEAVKKLNQTIETLVKRVKKCQTDALHKIEETDAQIKADIQREILGGFSISFANIGSERISQSKEAKLASYQDKIFEALKNVAELFGSPDQLPQALFERFNQLKEKALEITNVDFIENYYSISVIQFVKESEKFKNLIDRFNEVYMRYEFLCNEAGLIAKKYIVAEENISVIQTEIERLEHEDAENQTKAFIANAIDEAMKEMGYDLVGHREVTKKSGRSTKHELYHFGEGTGVDVTFSSDGQITMELGGFDDRDRTPDEAEASRLCDDMQRFCGQYAALERVLEKKGVMRRNIQILPPTRDFAQIINTTDYDMEKPVQKLEIKKTQKTGEQVRHTE